MLRSTHKPRCAALTTRKYIIKYIVITVLLYAAAVSVLSLYFCPQLGLTALHMAANEGKVDVARLLTDAGAQLNIQTKVHTQTCPVS